MSLRRLSLILLLAMSTCSLLGAGLTFALAERQREAAGNSQMAVAAVTGTGAQLLAVIKDLNLDVVQVQQFLTDVSATRALNGLDDGFDHASRHARQLELDIDRGLELARALGRADLAASFERVRVAFPPYYAMGQQMAHAYVAEGAPGGNRLMPGFDASADEIGRQLGLVTADVEGTVAELNTVAEGESRVVTWHAKVMLALAFVFCVAGFAAAGGLWLFLNRAIMRPIVEMTGVMRRLADAELDVAIPMRGRTDELGQMAHAVEVFKANALEGLRLREAQDSDRVAASAAQRAALMTMGDRVEALVRSTAERVQVQMLALTKDAASQDAERSADGAAEQALHCAEMAAATAEELASAIREVAEQAADSTAVVRSAVEIGKEASTTIQSLANAVAAIGDFAGSISAIASQTNLLALNATIEAARAGESGRGFAVVAQEVKALAAESGKASDAIRDRVEQISRATEAAVAAVDGICREITRVDVTAGAIAAAVEEQNAATQGIRHNAGQTAELARAVCRTSLEIANEVQALPKILVHALRTSVSEVDRRLTERLSVDLAASLILSGGTVPVTVRNLSLGGACVHGQLAPARMARGRLACPGLPAEIDFTVVDGAKGEWHLRFERRLEEEDLQRLVSSAAGPRAA